MIFEALQSDLFRFKFPSLGSKLQKNAFNEKLTMMPNIHLLVTDVGYKYG